MSVHNFQEYSQFYDALYQNKNYGSEVEYILARLNFNKTDELDLLEIGCGTGGHALHFAKAGFRVHGIDLSPEMIRLAEQKKDEWTSSVRDRVEYECQDARTFRSLKRFDVVASMFHVMSYQLENSDVNQCFETAFAALKPGGYFVFDYWNGSGVLTERPETRVKRFSLTNGSSATRISEPRMSPVQNRVDISYEIIFNKAELIANEGESLPVVREEHSMRYFGQKELELFARDLFVPVGHFGWQKPESPGLYDWYALSVFRKIE